MNDNGKIKLDMSKLYGFRIVQAKKTEKCLTPKIGDSKASVKSDPTLKENQ